MSNEFDDLKRRQQKASNEFMSRKTSKDNDRRDIRRNLEAYQREFNLRLGPVIDNLINAYYKYPSSSDWPTSIELLESIIFVPEDTRDKFVEYALTWRLLGKRGVELSGDWNYNTLLTVRLNFTPTKAQKWPDYCLIQRPNYKRLNEDGQYVDADIEIYDLSKIGIATGINKLYSPNVLALNDYIHYNSLLEDIERWTSNIETCYRLIEKVEELGDDPQAVIDKIKWYERMIQKNKERVAKIKDGN